MATIARPYKVFANAIHCPACTLRNGNSLRTFTSCAQRQKYGPESPKYIDVPEPPQRTAPLRPRIKGILPIPRDIFKHREGGHEARGLGEQPNAHRSLAGRGTTDTERARNDWRQKMTDARKTNYREGILELAKRKRATLAKLHARSAKMSAERAALMAMPEREDERLTNPTIAMVMKPLARSGILPDPNREQRLAEMKARVAAKEAQRAGDRRDALHTLYMHARDFITSEVHLDREIETVFGTPEAPVIFKGGNSMWSHGKPEDIKAMLARANRTSGTEKDNDWVNQVLRNRINKIAEKLTGGTI